jgi:DNA-binding response OmpR family regulator
MDTHSYQIGDRVRLAQPYFGMSAPRQVLIGESNSAVRALLARAVLSTYAAAEADLLLLTHGLPILSGIQVIRALRTQGARVPILVISSDPIEDAALRAGANRFLRKPFTLKAVRTLLVELLPLAVEI